MSIDAGDNLVTSIKPLCAATTRPGCMGELGMFGSVFDLKATSFKEPLLVSGTDGVGTKLLVSYLFISIWGLSKEGSGVN